MTDTERDQWTDTLSGAALKLAAGGSSVLASVLHAPDSGAQIALPASTGAVDAPYLERLARLHEEWRAAALASLPASGETSAK